MENVLSYFPYSKLISHFDGGNSLASPLTSDTLNEICFKVLTNDVNMLINVGITTTGKIYERSE